MDIEQLKLVIDLLKTISGDMETVALAYVSFLGLVGLVPYLVLVYAIKKIVEFLKSWLGRDTKEPVASENEFRRAVNEINDALGNAGSKYPYWKHELDAIVNAVKVLKNESKKGTS